MKTRILIATAAITIGFASSAAAAAKAPTDVTITGNGGDYYGYVQSPKSSCESNRTVNVYKLVGQSPDPSADQKIGSDIAQPNGPDGMWSIGNSGYKHGKFYAQVKKTSQCQSDLSPVISR